MEQTQSKNYTLPIIVMFALFFMIAFVTGLPSPMGVIVAKQFGASAVESQLGFFANFIAYAFMGWPAGVMLKRIGYKKTSLAAVTVGFIGVAIQYYSGVAESFAVYLTGAFVCGFSMCMLNTVVNPMLNTLGGGGSKGNSLLQFGGSLNSLGATIVPYLIGWLMGAEAGRTIAKANPAMFLAMGIFAIAFVVIAMTKIPEPHIERKSDKKAVADTHSAFSFRHFILGIIAIFVYVGVEVGIPSTANLYMTQELKIDATTAGLLVGLYWLLMLCGRLVGGVVGAKIPTKVMLGSVTFGAMVLVAAAILMPQGVAFTIAGRVIPLSIILLTLCGLCTSVMWGSIFNLAVEGLGKYTAMASGFFMVMVCGGGIIPLVQAVVAKSAGYIASYWVIFACIAYMFYYALSGSKNVNTDIKVD